MPDTNPLGPQPPFDPTTTTVFGTITLSRIAGVLRTALIAAYAPATEASSDSTTAPGRSTATGPGLVPADVFGWADPALRELARAYDAARIAGLACERAYDALSRSNAEVRSTTD